MYVRKWGKIKKGSRFLKTVWQYLLNTQTKWPSSFHLRDVANRNVCFYGPEEMCTKIQSHRLQGAADWKQVKCLLTRESYFSLGSPGKQNLKWKLTFCHVPKDQTWRLSWWRTRLRCRRHGFDPWVGKIPWRRERLPTPVLWPGESHGLYSPWGHKESDTTERLWLSLRTRIPGRQEGGREEANRGCTVSCHLLSPSGAEQVCSQNRDLLIADRNAAGRGNMNSVSPAPTEPRYGGPSTDGLPLILKDRTPAPPWAGVVTSFPYAWHCPRERMPVCPTSRPSFMSSFISWSLGSLLNEVIGVS